MQPQCTFVDALKVLARRHDDKHLLTLDSPVMWRHVARELLHSRIPESEKQSLRGLLTLTAKQIKQLCRVWPDAVPAALTALRN